MKPVGHHNSWTIYQNSTGQLEAYCCKKKVKKSDQGEEEVIEKKQLKRMVLLATTLRDAYAEIELRTSKRPKVQEKPDPQQLSIQ